MSTFSLTQNILVDEKRGRSSYDCQKSSQRKKSCMEKSRSAIPNLASNWLPILGNNDIAEKEIDKKRPRKKGWNKNINPKEKLIFIWECCKHFKEY